MLLQSGLQTGFPVNIFPLNHEAWTYNTFIYMPFNFREGSVIADIFLIVKNESYNLRDDANATYVTTGGK